MITVQQLLRDKGGQVYAIGPGATVYEGVATMADKGVGALMVMESERMVGIFSERDYARKIVLKDRSSRDTLIRDIMSPRVITVSPEASIDDCMRLMTQHKFRHLPVVDGERVVGMLTIGDLLKAIITEKQSLIEQLEHYIHGSP
jgi:CBS domain-containing protein